MTSPAEAQLRKSDYGPSYTWIKSRAATSMTDGHWKFAQHVFEVEGSPERNELFKYATAQIAMAGHTASYYSVFCKEPES